MNLLFQRAMPLSSFDFTNTDPANHFDSTPRLDGFDLAGDTATSYANPICFVRNPDHLKEVESIKPSISFPTATGFRPLTGPLATFGEYVRYNFADFPESAVSISKFLRKPAQAEQFLAALSTKPNTCKRFHKLLADPAELPMLRDNFQFRTALEAARVHRWASTRNSFVLPRLLYAPELCDPDHLGDDLKQLDDVDLCQMALAHMMNFPEVEAARTELSELTTHGGVHHDLLIHAIQREVVSWSELFDFPDLLNHIEDWKNGLPLPVITMTRFMPIEFLRDDPQQLSTKKRAEIGHMTSHLLPDQNTYQEKHWAELMYFDKPAGMHFFSPQIFNSTDPTQQFLKYGLPNLQNGIISQLAYQIPLPVFLIFLAASDGKAYLGSSEFALWEDATHLFNLMIKNIPNIKTKIRIYHFDGSEAAQNDIQRLRRFNIEIERGTPGKDSTWVVDEWEAIIEENELEDGLNIDREDIVARSRFIIDNHQFIKRSLVGTDDNNIESLFYLITLMPTKQAIEIISYLVSTQPSLAQEAAQFYSGLETSTLSDWISAESTSVDVKNWISTIHDKQLENEELFNRLSQIRSCI